jgi:hypothetical protein
MSRFGTFKIDGITYDLDDLTLDEVEQIEEQSGGVPFSEVNYGSAKGMKAFAYVLMKRNNPDLTMEDVGRVKIVSLESPDEEMPDLPPVPSATTEAAESPNGSVADDSGAPLSVESTSG